MDLFRKNSEHKRNKSDGSAAVTAALGAHGASTDHKDKLKKQPLTPIRHYKERIRTLETDNMELKILIEQFNAEAEDLKVELEHVNSRVEVLLDAIQRVKNEPAIAVVPENEANSETSEKKEPENPFKRVILLAEVRRGMNLKRVSKIQKQNRIIRSSRINFGEQLRSIMATRAAQAQIAEDEEDDEWK